MNGISKIARFFQRIQIETYLAAFLLLFLSVLLSIQVFVRFVFAGGLAWTEELSRYAFVWAVYFGCILGVKENKHIRVTAQFLLIPKRVENIILIVADLGWIAFSGMIAFFGLNFVLSMFEFPFISQTMGFNLAWAYAIVPLAYGIMLFYVAILVCKRIKQFIKKEDTLTVDPTISI
ncbi:MAG: TRAP transporter small permease [Treponema sp.]|nr:TRAP transporter small permease [Treponema sp.]